MNRKDTDSGLYDRLLGKGHLRPLGCYHCGNYLNRGSASIVTRAREVGLQGKAVQRLPSEERVRVSPQLAKSRFNLSGAAMLNLRCVDSRRHSVRTSLLNPRGSSFLSACSNA